MKSVVKRKSWGSSERINGLSNSYNKVTLISLRSKSVGGRGWGSWGRTYRLSNSHK